MQTPKARTSSSGGPPRVSPRSVCSDEVSQKKSSPQAAASSETPQKISPRVVRQLKTGPRYSDHTASSSLASRGPNNRSPKVTEHKSPNSPNPEKKRPSSRVSELEGQISQLENDLEIVKDLLCSTEALKKQAQKDVEESNQQLVALTLKLEESQKQLEKKSASEEIVGETSEDRDERLRSELEAIREKSSCDSAALVSALDEIEQLKVQLEMVAESEAAKSESEQEEFRKLKENLSRTLLIVEEMKNELKSTQESEAQAQALVGETLMQLETAKKMVETLRSDGLKTMDDYNAVALELEQSKARVGSLEELVKKLNADISKNEERGSQGSAETEVHSLKNEVEELRLALMAAEMRQSRNEEEIRTALEVVEKIKSASEEREAELKMAIQKSKFEIEELKANLMDKETELQAICEENEGLNAKLESSLSGQRGNELEKKLNESNTEMENLKASLMEKETEMEKSLKENQKLKMEINKSDDIESARAAEREAVMKVGYMMEEVDKSNRRVERVGEQLEAVQAANAEMEGELRKLKVQSEQWRKAAEAAAAMLSAGNNGQVMERTGSMDSHYNSPRMGKISSPYGDDMDEDLLKKKNANVLKRFGVLWKKPQK